MTDYFTGAYDDVFERLAVADTTSSAGKKKSLYGGGIQPNRSNSTTRSRPQTPSSLYETPSFSSNKSSRKVSSALFDRLANTETYATAKMKGKVPNKNRSMSTPRKTSNAFFERMAYTETFASAQMKGLINTENERAVSRSRSVKSAKSTRTISRGRASRESGESFFDRMARTDTYASAQLKGKYHDDTTSQKSKYTPKRHSRGSTTSSSIFDRLSRTQTKSSAQFRRHNAVTPDPFKSRAYAYGGRSEPRRPKYSSSASYNTPGRYSSNASVGSTKSATSARSTYTAKSAKSLRSTTSVRSAYTAPSIRTTRTAATTKSSASSRAQSITSSYHSERRMVKPSPRRNVVRKSPVVKPTSPTPYSSTTRKKTPSSYLPSKFTSSPLKNGFSTTSSSKSFTAPSPRVAAKKQPVVSKKPVTVTKAAPKPTPPPPPPRPVLQFESDDELSFGDESDEEDVDLAAPSSVKGEPQDKGEDDVVEKDEGEAQVEETTPIPAPETSAADFSMSFEDDDEEENEPEAEREEDPIVDREGVEPESYDDAGMEDEYEEEFEPAAASASAEYEPEDEYEQEEEPEDDPVPVPSEEMAAPAVADVGHESDDGLSIGSEETEPEEPVPQEEREEEEEVTPMDDQDMDDVQDELGDLLDSQSDSPQLSVEDGEAALDYEETEDSAHLPDADSLNDVMGSTHDSEDPIDEAEFDEEPDEYDEDIIDEDEEFYEDSPTMDEEEIRELDSLDLVLDATGDEDDISANGPESDDEEEDVLDAIEEQELAAKETEQELIEEEEEQDYFSEGEVDQTLEEAEFVDEEDEQVIAAAEVGEEPVVEEEEEEREPKYKIIKSEKYHPEYGFEEVRPDEIFLTETLLAFEDGEISNQEMAVLLIEALFEKNFENGDHWEVDAGTARDLEEDEGGGGDLEGRAFVVKRQARLDWNDLYSVAAAKGSIIVCPDEKEIRVENYSYFVAG